MNPLDWRKTSFLALLMPFLLFGCRANVQKINVGTTETKRSVTTLLPKDIALQYLQSHSDDQCQFKQKEIISQEEHYSYTGLRAMENTFGSESFIFVNSPQKKGSQVVCSWIGLVPKESGKILTSLVSLGVGRSCKSLSHIEHNVNDTNLLPQDIALRYLQNKVENSCIFSEKGLTRATKTVLLFEQLRVAADSGPTESNPRSLLLFLHKGEQKPEHLCTWLNLKPQPFERLLTALFSLGVEVRCR